MYTANTVSVVISKNTVDGGGNQVIWQDAFQIRRMPRSQACWQQSFDELVKPQPMNFGRAARPAVAAGDLTLQQVSSCQVVVPPNIKIVRFKHVVVRDQGWKIIQAST